MCHIISIYRFGGADGDGIGGFGAGALGGKSARNSGAGGDFGGGGANSDEEGPEHTRQLLFSG